MQYNVIYFTQTVEYIGRSEAFYCVPAVDYISMVKTVIKIPKAEFKLEKGMLVRVNNTSGVIYEGVISDISIGKESYLELSCLPLESLLDANVYTLSLNDTNRYLFNWIKSAIQMISVDGKSPRFYFGNDKGVDAFNEIQAHLGDERITNIRDVLVSLLRNKGYRIDLSIDWANAWIKCIGVQNDNSKAYKFDLSLNDLIDYNINSGSSELSPNVCVCIDKIKAEQNQLVQKKYYFIPTADGMSGTIENTSDGIISPVVTAVQTIEYKVENGESFEQNALSTATETLYKNLYDEETTIKFYTKSKVLEPFEIGKLYQIFNNGTSHFSICTGYENEGDNIQVVKFGYARKSLTSIIRSIRRDNQ